MKKLTISASIRFKEITRKVISDLEKVGVIGLFPNLDSKVAKQDLDLVLMKKLETDHFSAIDSSDGLYVICPEGRVGTLVSVEIGYAVSKKKVIIFSETPEDLGLQALASQCIPLEEVDMIKDL